MSKGKRKAYDRRVLRKKLNRDHYDGFSKMLGRYCRYHYGSGI